MLLKLNTEECSNPGRNPIQDPTGFTQDDLPKFAQDPTQVHKGSYPDPKWQ